MWDSPEYKRVLHYRGVETPCPICKGLGWKAYAKGCTWHGGVGTNMIAYDVCDTCWGSGDAHRHGIDLRELYATMDRQIAEGAMALLASAAGANLEFTKPTTLAIAEELNRLSRSRKVRPAYFRAMCEALARTLRRGSKDPEVIQKSGKCTCCERGGEYNGYHTGPTIFTCPKNCTCHD